jgi:hypothetical protein
MPAQVTPLPYHKYASYQVLQADQNAFRVVALDVGGYEVQAEFLDVVLDAVRNAVRDVVLA